MSLDDPTPPPQHGLDPDRVSRDAVARPVGGHEAQTPGSGPEHGLRIDRITIGERHRKSFGRIEELAESIAQLGLLQPIGVDRGHRLIFGARRIKAFEHLGRKTIPARVIAIDDLLDGEHAENLIRKEFTTSGRVAIGKSMAARLGERQGQRTDLELPQNFAEVEPGAETRDIAAEHAGFGNHETYRQAEKVCDEGVPEIVKLMDEERISISAAAKLVDESPDYQRAILQKVAEGTPVPLARRELKTEALQQTTAFPEGKHRVLYADPAWLYGNDLARSMSGSTTPADHYPPMSIAELCDLRDARGRHVRDLAMDDSVLFLWVPMPLLEECFPVIHAWGFQYKTGIVWDKVKHNYGHYTSVRAELLLICVRGSCTPDVQDKIDNVVTVEKSRVHSQKPERFREIIDELYPYGPRIELFARGKVPKPWIAWGHEAVVSAGDAP